ncbi:hypothetical protein SCHPADRAFT_908199 [Schizopora paradoxa]|uniref:Carbohydrate esterase family 16 protein n=1 Tax=Schizopora paradoxa TaxID=27342 RepID=A0A0H2RHH8_9AGAM|nr:hypothetical protein SCHPADRAFT_908199 [Schizopora paradoxa]
MDRFESVTGPNWPGIDCIKHLFVFGDSYSSVGYDQFTIQEHPHPSVDHPLGIPFPGHTWTDDSAGMGDEGMSENPNWVGHLVTSRRNAEKPIVVYDYAVGGHCVLDVRGQIEDTFAGHVASQPEWARWKGGNSLFVVWVGINDCAGPTPYEPIVKDLMGVVDLLYEMGAINFLLIDVPPIDKSPAIPDSILEERPELADDYKNWNALLHKHTKEFHTAHPKSTILMYSSYDLFTRVNQEPVKYGFAAKDVKRRRGPMWMDHLHPTSKMHKVIADDIEAFLKRFPAHKDNEPSLTP